MWDERYAEEGFAYGAEPNDFLAAMADRLPGGDALCLAEGEGRNAVFLARRGLRVTALDQSAVGLAKARRLAEDAGVAIDTVQADLSDYAIEERRWDVIVAIWCHLPSALRRRVFAAAARALRPGGVFVLESYTPAQLELRTGGPPVRDLLVTVEELREDLAGLDLEHALELRRAIHEGRYHDGESAVAQVLARRPAR